MHMIIFLIYKLVHIHKSDSGPADNHTVYRSSCRTDGLFKLTDRDMRIKNGLIASSYQRDLSHCARQCLMINRCLSINFNPGISQNSNCETFESSKTNSTSALEASTGWKHYEPIVTVRISPFHFDNHFRGPDIATQ